MIIYYGNQAIVECARKYMLQSIKEGKTSQVIFGSQENKMEDLIKKGKIILL